MRTVRGVGTEKGNVDIFVENWGCEAPEIEGEAQNKGKESVLGESLARHFNL